MAAAGAARAGHHRAARPGRPGRLLEARRSAEALGALSTAATLDLQLAAVSHLRFELDEGARYARDTLALSERLGLDRARVMALWFLAENHALRRERGETERLLTLTRAAAPGDPEVDGMVWAGARAMTALLDDDRAGRLRRAGGGMAILPRQPQSPGHYRGMWPLLLAAEGDPRAGDALAEARALGIDVNRINRGCSPPPRRSCAAAVATPQPPRWRAARGTTSPGIPFGANLPCFSRRGRHTATAGATPAAGWRRPPTGSTRHGLGELAARCTAIASPPAGRWAGLGITSREAEVLGLVADGLANKQIAERLTLSVRTVEKHVESLLRKTGCASRTQLAALVRS